MSAIAADATRLPAATGDALEGRQAAGLRSSLRTGLRRHNWALLLFVLLVPLQNVHVDKLPNLGGGLNFLNVMFVGALLMAMRVRGGLVQGTGINGWMAAYMVTAVVSLLVGYATVIDPSAHPNLLKDHLVALSFLWLAQMSVVDWGGIRRYLLATLVPLPYMAYVVWNQHSAVSSWHYDHALRVSGTFSLLGANEFAAFCTTMFLLALALLLVLRVGLGWRVVLLGALACAGVGVVLTYSRTAYVAVLAGTLLILALRHRRAQLVAPVLALLLLAPAWLPYSVVERFQSITVEEDSADKSTADRFKYWGIALERFTQYPVLGVGYHAFHHAEVNPYRTDTHNFFLRELAEKGIFGLVVLFGLLAAVWRTLWRLYKRTPHGSWPHGLAMGLLAALLALCISNLFGDRFTYYPMIAYFWLYVGLALRAVQLQREQRGRQLPAQPAARAGRPRLALVNQWNPPLAHVPSPHA